MPRLRRLNAPGEWRRKAAGTFPSVLEISPEPPLSPLESTRLAPRILYRFAGIRRVFSENLPEITEPLPAFPQFSPPIPPAFFEDPSPFSQSLRQFPPAFAEKPRKVARKSRRRYPNIPGNHRRFLRRLRRNGEAFPLKSWESVSISDNTHP